ncbi:HAD family hydrolase [Patescibacteria group bacterium]
MTESKYKLVVFDQDGVLVLGDALDDMANFLGAGKDSAAFTEKLHAGKISLREVLDGKKAILKRFPQDEVAKSMSAIKIDPEAKIVINELRGRDMQTMLITRSFEFVGAYTQEQLGIDYIAGSTSAITMDGEAKDEAMLEKAQELKIDPEKILAVSDSPSDKEMLEKAGQGLTIRPINGMEKYFPEIKSLKEILDYI